MDAPDLADLDAFAAVAGARSFRGAAKRRNVSASALSEAIRRLEARLDVRLLNRTTRSVTLTEAGQALLNRLGPALDEIGSALDTVQGFGRGVGGTLRLNVPTVAAELILPSLLPRFMQAHPLVAVEVMAENTFVDVLAAGFDAGIRYGEHMERDMIAIPIGPRQQRYVTAAAPACLARHGLPRHPSELLDLPCIRYRFPSGVEAPWEFSRGGEQVKILPKAVLVTNRVELQLAAARHGLGFIHSFEGFIAPAVADGSLQLVLEDWSERFPGPYLYYASRRHMPPALRAFVDFVKAEQAAGGQCDTNASPSNFDVD